MNFTMKMIDMTAIKQLHHMKKIVIRQADKGSCTVIVDREQYLREGHEHLEDPKTYQQCAADRTVEIAHKANWAVEHHHKIGTISKYYRSQLLTNTEQVRTQHLYFLRKVHKHPHRLRPIVSASSGPTERISGHLVRMLGPYLSEGHSQLSWKFVRVGEHAGRSGSQPESRPSTCHF